MMEAIHSEYHFELKTADTVIVFIHGIQGSPVQFGYMIEKLNGAYSIENLLLPGHGSTMKAFARSSMEQWQNYVDEKIKQLENVYENIILVGHSMGCLLSVQAALSYPRRIRGLFLLAIPLKIRIRFPYVKNGAIIGFSKKNHNEVIAAGRKGNSISASNPLEYLAGIWRYIEVLAKSRSTRELLRRIKVPITVVQSADDEIVSKASLRYVDQMKNVQVRLVQSGHYYYPKAVKELISEALTQFIQHVVSIE